MAVLGGDGHLLALVGHVGAARAGDLRVRVRHQPLALVLPQNRQEVQTCRMAHIIIRVKRSPAPSRGATGHSCPIDSTAEVTQSLQLQAPSADGKEAGNVSFHAVLIGTGLAGQQHGSIRRQAAPAGPQASRPWLQNRRTAALSAGSFLRPSSCLATESVTTTNVCSPAGRPRPNSPCLARAYAQEDAKLILVVSGVIVGYILHVHLTVLKHVAYDDPMREAQSKKNRFIVGCTTDKWTTLFHHRFLSHCVAAWKANFASIRRHRALLIQ